MSKIGGKEMIEQKIPEIDIVVHTPIEETDMFGGYFYNLYYTDNIGAENCCRK